MATAANTRRALKEPSEYIFLIDSTWELNELTVSFQIGETAAFSRFLSCPAVPIRVQSGWKGDQKLHSFLSML